MALTALGLAVLAIAHFQPLIAQRLAGRKHPKAPGVTPLLLLQSPLYDSLAGVAHSLAGIESILPSNSQTHQQSPKDKITNFLQARINLMKPLLQHLAVVAATNKPTHHDALPDALENLQMALNTTAEISKSPVDQHFPQIIASNVSQRIKNAQKHTQTMKKHITKSQTNTKPLVENFILEHFVPISENTYTITKVIASPQSTINYANHAKKIWNDTHKSLEQAAIHNLELVDQLLLHAQTADQFDRSQTHQLTNLLRYLDTSEDDPLYSLQKYSNFTWPSLVEYLLPMRGAILQVLHKQPHIHYPTISDDNQSSQLLGGRPTHRHKNTGRKTPADDYSTESKNHKKSSHNKSNRKTYSESELTMAKAIGQLEQMQEIVPRLAELHVALESTQPLVVFALNRANRRADRVGRTVTKNNEFGQQLALARNQLTAHLEKIRGALKRSVLGAKVEGETVEDLKATIPSIEAISSADKATRFSKELASLEELTRRLRSESALLERLSQQTIV